MASYGNYGGRYDDDYGYNNSGGRSGRGRRFGGRGQSQSGNRGYGQNGSWQDDGTRGRKRRFQYDQIQQFDQKGDFWGGDIEYYDYEEGWGDGEEDYGDGYYDEGYQGTQQWGDQDYYGEYADGYGSSRKRGRFRDGPVGRNSGGGRRRGDGPPRRRDPNSFSFYDEYPEDSSRRRDDRWTNDRPGRRRRKDSRSRDQRRRRGDRQDFRRRSSERSRRDRGPSHKKSDAEDAIYEKHKLVTVEREKRTRIGDTVHVLLTAIREVAKELANPPSEEELQKKEEKEETKPEKAEETKLVKDEEENPEKGESAISMEDSVSKTEESETAKDEDDAVKDKSETNAATEEKNSEALATEDIETEEKCKADPDATAEDTAEEKAISSEKRHKSIEEKFTKKKPVPVLIGSVRCGESAMRILVGDTLQALIVILCKKKPTRSLLEKVKDMLEVRVAADSKMKGEKFTLHINDEKEYIVLKQESIEGFELVLRLTSPECSVDAKKSDEDELEEEPEDLLSLDNCRESLVMIRRMRFFVNKLDLSPVCLTVVRILLHLRSNPGFGSLPVWLTLVLVCLARSSVEDTDKKSEKKTSGDLRVDTILIRCLEVLSSGVLLPPGHGILDPCEEGLDVTAGLSAQDSEDVTGAAQRALRMIYFGQIRTLLGIAKSE